jgi:hypothetical protein
VGFGGWGCLAQTDLGSAEQYRIEWTVMVNMYGTPSSRFFIESERSILRSGCHGRAFIRDIQVGLLFDMQQNRSKARGTGIGEVSAPTVSGRLFHLLV